MSVIVDNPEDAITLQVQNQEIIKLLKAILAGIEIISDQENLIEISED